MIAYMALFLTPLCQSAQKVDPGEENSPTAPAGIRTRDLSITSPALKPLSYPRPSLGADKTVKAA